MAWKRYILHIGHDEEVYWEIKIMFHGYENWEEAGQAGLLTTSKVFEIVTTWLRRLQEIIFTVKFFTGINKPGEIIKVSKSQKGILVSINLTNGPMIFFKYFCLSESKNVRWPQLIYNETIFLYLITS